VGAIQIYSGPHDQHEIRKRVTAFRPPCLIRCEVAGNDFRLGSRTEEPEGLITAQVGRRIDVLPATKKWRVGAWKKTCSGESHWTWLRLALSESFVFHLLSQ